MIFVAGAAAVADRSTKLAPYGFETFVPAQNQNVLPLAAAALRPAVLMRTTDSPPPIGPTPTSGAPSLENSREQRGQQHISCVPADWRNQGDDQELHPARGRKAGFGRNGRVSARAEGEADRMKQSGRTLEEDPEQNEADDQAERNRGISQF